MDRDRTDPAPGEQPGGDENDLAHLAEEAAREIEQRRDGSGGHAGKGDVG